MTDPILEALGMTTQPEKKSSKKKLPEPPQDIYEEAYSLQEKKLQEEIRKLKIDNDVKLRNLVDKKLVQSILDSVGHSIQTNLVDRGRREAPVMAAKLGIPEKEKELEIMMNEQDEKSIDSIIDNIIKLCDDGVFE